MVARGHYWCIPSGLPNSNFIIASQTQRSNHYQNSAILLPPKWSNSALCCMHKTVYSANFIDSQSIYLYKPTLMCTVYIHNRCTNSPATCFGTPCVLYFHFNALHHEGALPLPGNMQCLKYVCFSNTVSLSISSLCVFFFSLPSFRFLFSQSCPVPPVLSTRSGAAHTVRTHIQTCRIPRHKLSFRSLMSFILQNTKLITLFTEFPFWAPP
jgi:hypothetical protein